MAKERLIWRPNAVSPEAWEAMSREEQINWWKAQRSPARPKSHVKEAISHYAKGHFTEIDFVTFVSEHVEPEEIEEFVRACPPDLLAILRDALADYGEDESVWPRTFHAGSHFPWVTPEEIGESTRRKQEQIWRGVRLLKEYFRR